MTTVWSLVYNGTEKEIGSKTGWAIASDLEISTESKGKCTVRCRSTERLDGAAEQQFAAYGAVTIYANRTLTAGVFSGGAKVFVGWVSAANRQASSGREWIEYQFADFWWLMEQHAFKQKRLSFQGWVNNDPVAGVPIMDEIIAAEVYLGEVMTFNGSGQWVSTDRTNGAQIDEVIDWFNECFTTWGGGNLIQAGTINPAVTVPVNRVQSIFCSDAIVSVLRWSPDAVMMRNWTTSPPTVSFISMASLTEVELTLTEEQESAISLSPQYARQLSGVLIYYLRTDIYDGRPFPQCYIDKADATGSALYLNGAKVSGGSPDPVITDKTPFVTSHHVQLAGRVENNVYASVLVSAISALTGGSQSQQVAWWQAADRTLSDPTVDVSSIVVETPTIVDANGTAVNTSTYPNMLLPGSSALYDWMGVAAIEATISANVSYNKCSDTGKQVTTAKVTKRLITQRVILTNATSKVYATLSEYDSGEAVPTGVAAAVFNSVKDLVQAGSITFLDKTLRSDIYVGCKLKLVGPNHTYENLVVQRVVQRPHTGVTEVEFGPCARLDATGLIELKRATSERTTWNMPSGRSTGIAPGFGAGVELTGKHPKENTSHSSSNNKLFAVTAPVTT